MDKIGEKLYKVDSYEVINKDSMYYGFKGYVTTDSTDSVWLQIVRDPSWERCFEGRQQFSKKELKRIYASEKLQIA
ncbi:hypothetical protein bcgnr5372_39140 [Bacillus luti]|nr:hypothetical protein [Bacillus cereus]HDR8330458.1 hypothetical protein [Bacillus cereus]HDR8337497.1 hypothetical protein [Bacillus cereus]